jgi:hypothetical protein
LLSSLLSFFLFSSAKGKCDFLLAQAKRENGFSEIEQKMNGENENGEKLDI